MMIKKMLISFLLIFSIITISLLLINNSGELVEDQVEDTEEEFNNEDYPYYLSDIDIEESIEMGMDAVDMLDFFMLPVNDLSSEKSDIREDITFAYIEPPLLTAVNYARNRYHQFRRIVRVQEVRDELSDTYLPFHVRFLGDRGMNYAVTLFQNGQEIEPISKDNQDTGTMISINIPTNEIDFSKNAVLRVESISDPEVYIEYQVNFSDYIHESN